MKYPSYEIFEIKRNVETKNKIKSFSRLTIGWFYGSGGPASEESITAALKICDAYAMCGMNETDSFIGADGTISITGYQNSFYLETCIYVDGKNDFLLEENGSDRICEEGIDERQLISTLRKAAKIIWSGYASSMLAITIQDAEVSTASHSKIHQMAEAPRSSAVNVSMQAEVRFVLISQNTTMNASREILPSFGKYRSIPFQPHAN